MLLAELPLAPLAARLKSGKLSLRDYIESTLFRLDTVDPVIHTLLPEPGRKERLLWEAEQLIEKYPDPEQRPPLYGILVGVKDLFNVDGLPTRAGSQLPAEEFAGTEAAIVKSLKQAGALILGKTVSTEFAYFQPGPTANPHDTSRTPGGSSSGSAAAVSAGICPLALGTQTIASITRPAAYCGIYGFKPSFGRISTSGIFPFSQSADHVGFMAQDLAGIALAAQSLIPDWSLEQSIRSSLRIGIPALEYLDQADAELRKEFQKWVEQLTAAGHTVIEYPLFQDIELINTIHRRLIAAEFARNHERLYSKYSQLYSQASRELFTSGALVSDEQLAADETKQAEYKSSTTKLSSDLGIDVWLSPSTTTTAPLGLASTGSPLMSLPWTFLGMPTLTIPLGRSEMGLPTGLQLAGCVNFDERLLQDSAHILKALV